MPIDAPGFDKTLELIGRIPSLKNRNRTTRGGRVYTPREVKEEMESLTWQARSQWREGQIALDPIENPEMSFKFFLPRLNKDVNNLYSTILDCLQHAGVIRNDNAKRLGRRAVIEDVERSAIEKVLIRITR